MVWPKRFLFRNLNRSLNLNLTEAGLRGRLRLRLDPKTNRAFQFVPPARSSPHMISVEAAVERILAALPAPGVEEIPLTEADGRFLAGRILSPVDLPNFDNSAVDGYAVRAE